MEWLEALKGLVQANLKNVFKIRTNKKDSSKKNSDNSSQAITFVNNGTVNVFNVSTGTDGLLDPVTLKQIQDVVRPAFEENDVIVLQEDSRQLLSSYKEFRNADETADLLAFFKGKISALDLRLLETGLYEVHLMTTQQADKAQQIKADVISKYGPRGKNVLNLASGGYFQTHIRPLYEALVDEGLEEDFKTEYDQIIEELPFAIFVHSGTSNEDVLQLLYEKAAKNIQYGVREETIILNGFGANADRIEQLIPLLQKKYSRIAPKVYYLGQLKTIQVAVYYREIKTQSDQPTQ